MMALSYDDIDDLAEKLLIDYYHTDRFPLTPIDIEAFARDYLHMAVRYDQLCYGKQTILGATAYCNTVIQIIPGQPETYKECDSNTILLDYSLEPEYSYARRAFTLAHECGHHAIAMLEPATQEHYHLRDLETQNDWKEWQANTFASCILMPKYLVECMMQILDHPEKYIVYGGNRMLYDEKRAILLLAKKMKVSFSAMLIRLKKLGFVENLDEEDYWIDAEYELAAESPYRPFTGRFAVPRPCKRRARAAKGGVVVVGDRNETLSLL